jgi:hypothetical protein
MKTSLPIGQDVEYHPSHLIGQQAKDLPSHKMSLKAALLNGQHD